MQSVEQFVENTFLVKLYEHTFASFEGCVTSWLGELTIACRLCNAVVWLATMNSKLVKLACHNPTCSFMTF